MIGYFPLFLLQVGILVPWWILWLSGYRLTTFMRGCFLMLFLAFTIGWSLRMYSYYWPHALTSKETILSIGPEKNYPVRCTLAINTPLVIEQRKDGWYYVSSACGKGWVQASDVAVEGEHAHT